MDYRTVMQIAAAGMELEKRRVDVAALNLANMHASNPAGQAPYAAQRVVAGPVQVNFSRAMGLAEPALPPRETTLAMSAAPPRLVHDPAHPHANAQGFVAYAAVDQATEMLTVSTALRAYEANVAVASTARAMAVKALEVGGAVVSPASIEAVMASSPGQTLASTAPASAAAPGFAARMVHELAGLNTQLLSAEQGVQKLASGTAENLHDVMLQLEQARLAMQLAAQVRSRVVEAYQDVMRMQV